MKETEWLDSALVVALGATSWGVVLSALMGCIFNWYRDKRARQKRIVEEFEHLCGDFLRIAAEYWSSPVDDGNRRKMQSLEGQIIASEFLLSRFISENFGNNAASMRAAIKNVRRVVTGGDFGNETRYADQERMTISIAAIVELRFAARKNNQADFSAIAKQ
ncbi:MAG: hypothetical protein ACR2P4_03020 [Gammaproteobacteria bacterium]